MKSQILIENLQIFAFHGVLPEETVLGTNYILNLELQADLWKASESDNLQDTINYAAIKDILHDEMAIPSQLMEHVIGRIIHQIQNKFPHIISIKVKLTKTNPPMKGEMEGVSVEMEKSFENIH